MKYRVAAIAFITFVLCIGFVSQAKAQVFPPVVGEYCFSEIIANADGNFPTEDRVWVCSNNPQECADRLAWRQLNYPPPYGSFADRCDGGGMSPAPLLCHNNTHQCFDVGPLSDPDTVVTYCYTDVGRCEAQMQDYRDFHSGDEGDQTTPVGCSTPSFRAMCRPAEDNSPTGTDNCFVTKDKDPGPAKLVLACYEEADECNYVYDAVDTSQVSLFGECSYEDIHCYQSHNEDESAWYFGCYPNESLCESETDSKPASDMYGFTGCLDINGLRTSSAFDMEVVGNSSWCVETMRTTSGRKTLSCTTTQDACLYIQEQCQEQGACNVTMQCRPLREVLDRDWHASSNGIFYETMASLRAFYASILEAGVPDIGDDLIDGQALSEFLDHVRSRSSNGQPNDNDGDGVENNEDNCVNTANPDQADEDGDGVGDACENGAGGNQGNNTPSEPVNCGEGIADEFCLQDPLTENENCYWDFETGTEVCVEGPNTIFSVIYLVVKGLTNILIPLSVLAIIYGGLQFIVARGNEEKVKNAKKTMTNILIGVGLIVGARILVEIVASLLQSL